MPIRILNLEMCHFSQVTIICSEWLLRWFSAVSYIILIFGRFLCFIFLLLSSQTSVLKAGGKLNLLPRLNC